MFNLPFADNSIDVVFTRQAIEPNYGKEKEILAELYRVAKQYLVLIEPAYELAGLEARRRMEKHGYIQNLYSSAKELELEILLWELYGVNEVELNPVGIMVIKKGDDAAISRNPGWACPVTKTGLKQFGNMLYSEESLLAYPIANNVPMLLEDYAIVATKMLDFYR